jgi:hypothetical protein
MSPIRPQVIEISVCGDIGADVKTNAWKEVCKERSILDLPGRFWAKAIERYSISKGGYIHHDVLRKLEFACHQNNCARLGRGLTATTAAGAGHNTALVLGFPVGVSLSRSNMANASLA